jgi:hypothetical protein
MQTERQLSKKILVQPAIDSRTTIAHRIRERVKLGTNDVPSCSILRCYFISSWVTT